MARFHSRIPFTPRTAWEDPIGLRFKPPEQIYRELADIFFTMYLNMIEIESKYLSRKTRSPHALRSAAGWCIIELEDALKKIGGCPNSALPVPLKVLLEELANEDLGIPSPLFHRDAGDNPHSINLLHTKAHAAAVLQRFKNENIAYKDGAKKIASALSPRPRALRRSTAGHVEPCR